MIPRAMPPARVDLLQPILVGVGLFACLATARAQVVLDGSFGTSGALTGPNYNIPGSAGLTRGNNLFQSFSQFNLKAGDVATFNGPANIQNILSRVTGGSPSSIDGTIRSGIAGANFYFINPSGVIFGPNASVDVSGAFAVSTANYLKLADGAKFVAALGADDSMLSSAPVAAFGFLNGAKGSIDVSGSLSSAPGTPLSVIGSTVNVHDGASLEALGSQINLTGVSGTGEITPSIQPSIIGGTPAQSGPNPSGTVVIRGGRLVVENANVDVSSTGGNLVVSLTDSLEVLSGGQLTTESSGATKGGNIIINAPKVTVDRQYGPVPTRIAAETSSNNPLGTGGDVIINSDSLDVLNGAEISVSAFGAADAGRVNITTGAMRVEGSGTQISANAASISGGPAGAGGQIVIHADSLDAGQYATISASSLGDGNSGSMDITAHSFSIDNASVTTYSSGAGNGGDIRIQSDTLSLNGSFGSITALALGLNNVLPAGRGGNIDIKTGSLTMFNDSAISSSTYGDGNAGNVTITADSMLLDTGHPSPGVFPGISTSSGPSFFGIPNKGNGGDIVINTGSLTMHNNMFISAATSTAGNGGNVSITASSVSVDGAASIQSSTDGAGQAGTVQLQSSGNIQLSSGGSISTSTSSMGNGGNVNITASSILVDNGASIQSSSDGAGRAGTVQLQSSGNIQLSSGGSVSTSAPHSSAGDILVTSGSELQLTDSAITARAGPGGGGNINVTAPDLVYLLRGSLDAQAIGDGGNLTIQAASIVVNQGGLISKSSTKNGGNISILSQAFLQSDTVIDSSAPFGIPGTVLVTAPDVDLSASLIPLPSSLLDAASQMRPDCAVRFSGDVSSFVILGRSGLPVEPGGFVPSGATSSGDEKH